MAGRGDRGGQFPRLGQIASQRPFAVNMLARRQRGQYNSAMLGHLHGDRDDVDIWIAHHRQRIAKGPCHAEGIRCIFGQLLGARRNRHNLELRHTLQRRNMGIVRPGPAGVGTDDADSQWAILQRAALHCSVHVRVSHKCAGQGPRGARAERVTQTSCISVPLTAAIDTCA